MSYKALSEKYARIILELEATRESEAMIMAHDAHAQTANRIQEQGKDWKGSQMPGYSKKQMPFWKLNPGLFNAPGKIEKFKKDASDGKNDGSYHALRAAYGLPTSKRTLTFDGNMFKSIIKKVTNRSKTGIEVTIMASDKENQNKVAANSRIVGENILQFSDEDKKLIRELNIKRIKKVFSSVK